MRSTLLLALWLVACPAGAASPPVRDLRFTEARGGTYSSLWNGKGVPAWVTELGREAARRGGDSALVVATIDSLYHWQANGTVVSVSVDSIPSVSQLPTDAQADSATYAVTFTMPRYYARANGTPDTTLLAEGYRRWELGYSCQSLAWRDSVATYGPAWGRDLSNMAAWLPGAQIVVVLSGYARPGEFVTVTPPPVASLYWPFTWWVRSWTGVPSQWSNPTRSLEHN